MKNTKLKGLFILLLFMQTITAIAQSYSLQENIGPNYSGRTRGLAWGHEFKSGFHYGNYKYIVATEREYGLFYAILYATSIQIRNKLSVYILNKDMKVIERKSLSPLSAANSKEIVITQWERAGDKLHVFFTYENKKDKNTYLFCTTYSLQDWKSETHKLSQYKTKTGGNFSVKLIDNERVSVLTLHFKSKIDPDKSPASNNIYDLGVYDGKWNLLKSKMGVDLKAGGAEFVESATVARNGDLFFITYKTGADLEKPSARKVNYLYIVGEKKLKTIKLIFNEQTNLLAKATPDVGSDTLLEVFVMTKSEKNGATEINFINFNRNTGKILDSAQFLVNNGNVANVEDLKKSVGTKLNSFTRNEDGSYVLYAENYSTWSQTTTEVVTKYTQSGTTTEYKTKTYYYYNYGPGMLLHIDIKNRSIINNMVVYNKTYTNYDPGKFATPKQIDSATYGVFSPESYAFCKLNSSVAKMTPIKNANGMNKFYAWTELVPMDEGFVSVYRKGGKHLTFSDLEIVKN